MRHTIEYIEAVICNNKKIDPKALHVKSRETILRETRQIIMYFATEAGCRQSEAAEYFGLKRIAAHHSRKVVNNYIDTEKDFRELIKKYRRLIYSGSLTIEQKVHFDQWLEALKQDTQRLLNELNKIKI